MLIGDLDKRGAEEGREAFRAAGLGDMIEQIAAREPLGRAGVPDDVARLPLFSASDLSSFMTGSTVAVDDWRCRRALHHHPIG